MQQPMYGGPQPVSYGCNPNISIIALVLAILNLCLVFLPLCSLPMTVAAPALGMVGIFSAPPDVARPPPVASAHQVSRLVSTRPAPETLTVLGHHTLAASPTRRSPSQSTSVQRNVRRLLCLTPILAVEECVDVGTLGEAAAVGLEPARLGTGPGLVRLVLTLEDPVDV